MIYGLCSAVLPIASKRDNRDKFRNKCLSQPLPFHLWTINLLERLTMAATKLASLATTLKALHKPGNPVILANVYDTLSAEAVAALPSAFALATASYAVARAVGVEDDDLDMETNLNAASLIGKVALKHNKPLTVNLQDGYGSQLSEAVNRFIDAGVVGINLEDYDRSTDDFFSVNDAVSRIKTTLRVAKEKKVPDFVVNARCDILVHGGSLEDTIARGKKYLAAGATSVFVWGGSSRGVSRGEVKKLVDAFDGRVNVSFKLGAKDALSVQEIQSLGVSRISVGPAIQFIAMKSFADEAKALLESK